MIVFDLVFWEVIDLNFLFIFGCVLNCINFFFELYIIYLMFQFNDLFVYFDEEVFLKGYLF